MLLPELATGLDDRAPQLRRRSPRTGRLVDSSAEVADALADRRAQLVRFVDQLDAIAGRLADRRVQLGDAVEAGERTLAVTARRERELGASLGELPPALAETDAALNAVTELSKPLAPALSGLQPAAERLPGALAALRGLVPEASGLVDDLETLAARAGPGLSELRDLLERLGPGARAANGSAADLEPIVAAIDRNKEGIGVLGDRFTGVFSTNDVNGPILRGLGFFEPFDPRNLGFGEASGSELERARLASVEALTQVCMRDNPVACLIPYLVPGLPEYVGDPDGEDGG